MYISSNKLNESIDYQIWSQLSDSDKILSLADLLHDYDNNIFYNDYNDNADIAIIQAKHGLSELLAIVGGSEIMKAAIIWDEKAASVSGGSFTSGAWRQRTLNTKLDPDSIISLATNIATIAVAGNYLIRASAPAYNTLMNQTRLLKNGVAVATGTIEYAQITNTQSRSFVQWVGTCNVNDTFTLEHRCNTTANTNGLGVSDSWGVMVYSVMELIQWT